MGSFSTDSITAGNYRFSDGGCCEEFDGEGECAEDCSGENNAFCISESDGIDNRFLR